MLHFSVCSHCKKLLNRPVQTKNGHRFCQHCWQEISKSTICWRCVEDNVQEDKKCNKLKTTHDVFSDKGVVFDIYHLPACCRACGMHASFFEINKSHIKGPCMEGRCCPCSKFQKLFEKLRDAFDC